MYNLRAFAEPSQVDDVVAALAALPEVCHVVLEGQTADGGKTLVTAEVEAASVDEAFAVLRGAGPPNIPLCTAPSSVSTSTSSAAMPRRDVVSVGTPRL